MQTVVLWNTRNLGYLTVVAGSQLAGGTLPAGQPFDRRRRLGALDVRRGEIILGEPLLMNKSNIDSYDF